MVDCGVSGKRAAESLAAVGGDACELSALLITHEHSDHIKSAGIMSRRYDLPVYANAATWGGMAEYIGGIKEHNVKEFTTGAKFCIGDITAEAFHIPHDAAEPVGYNFYLGDKKLTLATDIGHINDDLKNAIHGCHTILIESNHDVEMLKNGRYPVYLKKRILGNRGHLSNELTAELTLWLAERGTCNFLLGHLSEENNTPNLAYDTVHSALRSGSVKVGEDVTLNVADRNSHSKVYGAGDFEFIKAAVC